tara:strand:+ start:250 stop:504 length:255 start_codon:yes stop_codon:yes gene_type:complete
MDKYYLKFYIVGTLFLLFAAVVAIHYVILKESREGRRLVPWSFFINGVANIYLTLLILLYFTYGYKKSENYVYINGLEKMPYDE